jgi:uncharacterized phiE125 gp8 family phage protein
MYGVKRLTEPASEPVSLAELKLSQRVDGTEEDALLTALIVAARQLCEARIRRSVVATNWRLTLSAFPTHGGGSGAAITLPMPPAASVSTVKYRDDAGALITMPEADYSVIDLGDMTLIEPASGYWPTTKASAGAVLIEYVSGYAVGACPESIRRWIILAAGDMYANRERSTERATLPAQFADGLLDQYYTWAAP